MSRTAIYIAIGALFGAIAMGSHVAKAADLGKPVAAAPAATPEPVKDQWTGVYIEAGAGGQYIKGGDKALIGAAGIGYNYHAFGNPWVGGIFARYGFSAEGNSDAAVLTFDQPLTVAARFGYLVQPSTLLYGIAGYSKTIKGVDFHGPIVGLGAEAPLLGSTNMRFALEYTAQFNKDFSTTSDVAHNIMAFARFTY